MFLNIILTILVLVLIGISILIIFWWKKYGKTIFNVFGSLKNTTTKNNSEPNPKSNVSNLNKSFGDLNNAFGELNKAMGMLKNFDNGRNKNGK